MSSTESFAIRRRAPVSHAQLLRSVREARPTGERTLGGVKWEQKAEHVRQVAAEIYGKEAKDVTGAIIAELRQLPRFPEMNTRFMVEAWTLLGGLDRDIIAKGLDAEEEVAELDFDAYAQLKKAVRGWKPRGEYSSEHVDAQRAIMMRYCLAIVKANLESPA